MKNYRITRDEYYRWRENRPILVDTDGRFVRYATDNEIAAEFKSRQRGGIVKVKENDKLLSFSSDRELLKKEILAKHGECKVQLFNGKYLAAIHDPNKKPTPRVEEKIQISPERCQCANWTGRQAGRHHPVCYHNQFAPPEQQGFAAEQVLEASPTDVEEMKAKTPETTSDFVPTPEECQCRSWPKPPSADTTSHHPTCQWFDRWNMRLDPVAMLQGMDGRVYRPASTEEVKQARENAEARGTPIVTISGQTYLVVKNDVTVIMEPDSGVSTDTTESANP